MGIVEQGRAFSEVEACTIMKDVFNGVSYMYGVHMCHSDLKPENIVFGENGWLIIDLGTAFEIESDEIRYVIRYGTHLPAEAHKVLEAAKHPIRPDNKLFQGNKHVSQATISLICDLLNIEPSKRPAARACLVTVNSLQDSLIA